MNDTAPTVAVRLGDQRAQAQATPQRRRPRLTEWRCDCTIMRLLKNELLSDFSVRGSGDRPAAPAAGRRRRRPVSRGRSEWAHRDPTHDCWRRMLVYQYCSVRWANTAVRPGESMCTGRRPSAEPPALSNGRARRIPRPADQLSPIRSSAHSSRRECRRAKSPNKAESAAAVGVVQPGRAPVSGGPHPTGRSMSSIRGGAKLGQRALKRRMCSTPDWPLSRLRCFICARGGDRLPAQSPRRLAQRRSRPSDAGSHPTSPRRLPPKERPQLNVLSRLS